MATRRMLASDIFEDDFIRDLEWFGRLLWIGLVVRCADDQGRFQDNADLIKSQVFPADNLSSAKVENMLQTFSKAGKITRYVANGKKLIQIVAWWKYQTPQWAAQSKFAPPAEWTDRVKYHGQSGIVMVNWDKRGGYVSNLVSNQVDNPPSNPVEGDLNDVNVKGEGEGKAPPPPENCFAVYQHEIGPLTATVSEEIEVFLKDGCPDEYLSDAFREAARQNKRSWSYAKAIVKRWLTDGRGDKPKEGDKKPVYAEEW